VIGRCCPYYYGKKINFVEAPPASPYSQASLRLSNSRRDVNQEVLAGNCAIPKTGNRFTNTKVRVVRRRPGSVHNGTAR
jgi:hypothetical protein